MLHGASITQLQLWKTYFTPNSYSQDQFSNLTSQVAIVTGANTGLGYATMVVLEAHGAYVLTCLSEQRAMDAIKRAKMEIKDYYPNLAQDGVLGAGSQRHEEVSTGLQKVEKKFANQYPSLHLWYHDGPLCSQC